MGLNSWLARAAARSPHVLLVEAANGWAARIRAEQEILRRGWRVSASPADADVLVVCGRPTAAEVEAIERTWEQLPGPRSRTDVVRGSATLAATALDDALGWLLDDHAQRADAGDRILPPEEPSPADTGSDAGHMDHGHMDMPGPGGIALAAGGPDRDGLQMDVLHLRLGPVLAHWPAGLVLALSLQGDVVTDARVESVQSQSDDPSGRPARVWSAAESVAWRCDANASLLMLAGWARPAATARQVRDRALDPPPDTAIADEVEALRRCVARSRMLRWSLRDLAPVSQGTVPLLRGDVHDRLLRLLDVATDEARTGAVTSSGHGDLADVLPPLVIGAELAAVRLTVASVAGFMPASLSAAGPR